MLEFKDDGTWDTKIFNAHGMGVNAVSWAPAVAPGSLISTQPQSGSEIRKIATGGCDNLVKIWNFEYVRYCLPIVPCEETNLVCLVRRGIRGLRKRYYKAIRIGLEMLLLHLQSECRKHTLRLPLRYPSHDTLSNLSQDKTVIIWSQNAPGQPWKKQLLKNEPFPEAVWRVSWSLSGGILAVSSGDNKVALWREGLKGEWENVHQIE